MTDSIERSLDRHGWIAVLEDLDQLATERELPAFSLLVIGGAAMALAYGERSTSDIDVFNDDLPADLRTAAADVAELHHIRSDWLNDGGKGFAPSLVNAEPYTVVFQGQRLKVVVPPSTYLLATKLHSAREQDLPDVHRLMALTGITSADDLLELLCSAYPPGVLEIRMRYFAEGSASSFADSEQQEP